MQLKEGELKLLPALPNSCCKSFLKGISAKGWFRNKLMDWTNKKPINLTIYSEQI